MPWKAVSLDVELDLAEKGEKESRWQPVRLSFVRDVKEPGEAQVSKKDWALFLTTNIEHEHEQDAGDLCVALGISKYISRKRNSIWVSSRSRR
jgi:hypothetical protein